MATFNPAQLSAFYDRIRLPAQHRHLPGPALDALLSSPESSLELLSALQRHSICALPFENLSLHYSLNHRVHLSPAYLFDKCVTSPAGRGGYCMELNTLLYAVLRSLGFRVRHCGAKVCDESISARTHTSPRETLRFEGWGHMVLLVGIGAGQVLFDTGFGGGNPTKPMWLRDGEEMVNVVGSEDGEGEPHLVRLVRDRVEGNEMWVLDRLVRGPGLGDGVWRPFYAFTEMQFSNKDFEVINHYVATSRKSFFTFVVFVVMCVLSPDGESVVGSVTLHGRGAKKRMYGKVVEEREFKTELERIQTLEEWFGIKLDEVERAGITGLPSSIN